MGKSIHPLRKLRGGAFLTVCVANMVQGWEGSSSKGIPESPGPTDTMNRYMANDLSSQVVPYRSLRLCQS